jgi:hypothetical protein
MHTLLQMSRTTRRRALQTSSLAFAQTSNLELKYIEETRFLILTISSIVEAHISGEWEKRDYRYAAVDFLL